MLVFRLAAQVRLQLILLVFVVALLAMGHYGVIPSPEEMLDRLKRLFDQYGVAIVALFSFLENIPGLNAYFPGSIVILSAMAMTAGHPGKAISTFSFIVVSSFIAYHVSYFVGRRSLASVGPKHQSHLLYIASFFGHMWHPHFAALKCLKSGKDRLTYKRFITYLVPCSLFWNCFWGITMYNYGGLSTKMNSLIYLFILYLVIWAAYDAGTFSRKERKTKGSF